MQKELGYLLIRGHRSPILTPAPAARGWNELVYRPFGWFTRRNHSFLQGVRSESAVAISQVALRMMSRGKAAGSSDIAMKVLRGLKYWAKDLIFTS